jgi:hypothetical protein
MSELGCNISQGAILGDVLKDLSLKKTKVASIFLEKLLELRE